MFKTVVNAWRTPELKKKIIFTLVILLLYRLGSCIPVPYVNPLIISSPEAGFGNMGGIFNYLATISGNGFAQAKLFALSVSPYITAQIVIQLLTIAIPALERLSKDGEEGRKKINNYTRYLTIALSLVTAYGYYNLLKNNTLFLIDTNSETLRMLVMVSCYCAGAALVMWLADKINEHGIGNGVSMILFVNILSSGSEAAARLLSQIKAGGFYNIFSAILSVIIMLAVIVLIVFITNSERRIPVQYAKRVVGRKMYGGQSTHLPIKVNMSGVLPVIFAQSIASLPGTVMAFTGTPEGGFWGFMNKWFFSSTSVIYMVVYFFLIIGFSYFYSTIQFNPIEIANNMKKNGGFIPGFRPGKPTADFIAKVINKITLFGAIYLAFVALLPIILGAIIKDNTLAIGGTSVIIVVGVALETVKALEAQMLMRHYKGFLE